MRVHDSQAYRKMGVTRERISRILELREILMSIQTGFSLVNAAVVWSCLPFIRSGQNHLARHSERGRKTRQTEKEVGRQHQGMDRPGVRQVPGGSGEQKKKEETGCEIICGAPATLAVKG